MSSKRRNGPSASEARLRGVDWGAASLWLIGLGGVLLVATTVTGGSRPALALTFAAGPITNRDRLRFAGQVVGSALVGVGGVIAMVSKAPPLAFILATVGVAVVIGWLALSWRVRQFWLSELGLRRHSWGLACAESGGAGVCAIPSTTAPTTCGLLTAPTSGQHHPRISQRTRGASGGSVSERWAGATSGHE